MEDKIKKIAIEAARASGDILTKYFRSSLDVDVKDELSPLVSKVDREAEAVMRSIITNAFPKHIIKGEELNDYIPDGSSAETITWSLDPLDGTTAYLAGIPTFVILIGIWQGKKPLLGVMYQPLTKDLWIGETIGTTLNGKKIRVDDHPSQPFIVATTSPDYLSEPITKAFNEIRKKAIVTHFGGDGHIYGSFACGKISLIIEEGLKWHDLAALVPIILGSGGNICSFSGEKIEPGNKKYSIIACTSKLLKDEFLDSINGY